MPFVEESLVVRHREIFPGYYELEFIAPVIAKEALPGQFVHIRVGDSYDPLLRRPFSIYYVDKNLGSITVFYKVVGRGTQMLSCIHLEQRLDVMGPLGNSFSIGEGIGLAYLIGGGVGIAPLVYLARVLTEQKIEVKVLLGASSAGFLPGKDILKRLEIKYLVSTDDGSEGMRGPVTDLFIEQLALQKCDYIYACGPEPMLVKVTEIAREFGIPGEISLEEHMACGIGACLGCSHHVKDPDSREDGEYRLARVCCDGPVFRIGDVLFNHRNAR